MSIIQRMARHEALFRRMADRNGADLDLALQCGIISPGEVQSAVLSCTGCLQPGPCSDHLERDAKGIPEGCRNARLVRELADLMAF